MSKYKLSETGQKINNVLKYQTEELENIHFPIKEIDSSISESLELLHNLGYTAPHNQIKSEVVHKRIPIDIPSWESLCKEAERHVGTDCELESIFTDEELKSNELALKQLKMEFNQLHRLDQYDVAIGAVAGMLGATVDILLVGIPQRRKAGLEAGLLSDYVRAYFDKVFPEDEMQKLANSKASKVPFDAQDNRNTKIYVVILSILLYTFYSYIPIAMLHPLRKHNNVYA